jgi:hypothetical protein
LSLKNSLSFVVPINMHCLGKSRSAVMDFYRLQAAGAELDNFIEGRN